MPKCQNSNATFRMNFKHCVVDEFTLKLWHNILEIESIFFFRKTDVLVAYKVRNFIDLASRLFFSGEKMHLAQWLKILQKVSF